MDRLILHSDLNNFYASVECLLRPELAEVPLAVAGDPKKRHGVVLAKNAVAKKAGVRTGDTILDAEAKCPGLVFTPPHFDLYSEYSKRVFDIYTGFTPQVEPFGPDECWLDCTGCERLFGTGPEIADKILSAVRESTGLTVSVGISFTKSLAKLCSDLAEPNGKFAAGRDDFRQKLWGLPVEKLIYVGKSSQNKLRKLNIHTIGELATADDALLKNALGVSGLKLKTAAAGLETEPVRQCDIKRTAESVGHGMTAVKDVTDYETLRTIIGYLSDKVAGRMLKNGFRGSGVAVDLRSADLSHRGRQTRIARPTFAAADIIETAMKLCHELLDGSPFALRTITVSVFALSPIDGGVQLSFFDEKPEKREKLELAVEKIRARWGRGAVTTADTLGSDFIYDKNDDEDFLPFKR